MKQANVKIGMKVVPFRKTVPGWSVLSTSYTWKRAKDNNQKYLFVVSQDTEVAKNGWVLSDEMGFGGDFFRSSDFVPYNGK